MNDMIIQLTQTTVRLELRDYLQLFLLVAFFGIGSSQAADDVTLPLEGDPYLDLENLPQVVYIGTNDFPIENAKTATKAGITLGTYNLDAQRNLETHLADNLPVDDMALANTIVQQRFDALPEGAVQSAFEAVSLSARWDIRKAPAFVFGDGEAVIYGVSDVSEALEIWRAWQRGRRAR